MRRKEWARSRQISNDIVKNGADYALPSEQFARITKSTPFEKLYVNPEEEGRQLATGPKELEEIEVLVKEAMAQNQLQSQILSASISANGTEQVRNAWPPLSLRAQTHSHIGDIACPLDPVDPTSLPVACVIYVQSLKRYALLKKYCQKRIAEKTQFAFEKFEMDLMKKCGGISLASFTCVCVHSNTSQSKGDEIVLVCARLDHDYDCAFARICLNRIKDADAPAPTSRKVNKVREPVVTHFTPTYEKQCLRPQKPQGMYETVHMSYFMCPCQLSNK